MKRWRFSLVAMIIIMVMSSLLACGGPVVKRVNQPATTVQTTTTTTTPATPVPQTVTPQTMEIKTVKTATTSGGIVVSSKPIAYVRTGDPTKPAQSVAGKLCSPGGIWRRQIMLYNDATEDMVTERMRQYVSELVPNRAPIIESAGEWDNFGYWLMDKYGNPLSEPADNMVILAQPKIVAPSAVTQIVPQRITVETTTTFKDLMTSALNGVMISGNTITLSSDLLFDTGKDVIKPEGLRILVVIRSVIKNAYSDRPITIEGHTDNVPIHGRFRDNNDLSLARAEAVWLYFINYGLNQGNLYVQGFGESSPTASNSTEDGRRQNRRVVIKVTP